MYGYKILDMSQFIKARPNESKFYYHFIRGGYYSTSTSKIFIPMAGAEDLREGTSLTSLSEKFCFICAYDGSFEKAYARSENGCDSSVFGFYTIADSAGTEIPSATATQSVTVDMSAANTSYEFDFASAGTNTFSKGNILSFSFDPTNAPLDVHFMIVLKFDVST